MPDFDTLLALFKALSNDSRLKIVAILAENEVTVRELARRLRLKEPTVSEHLSVLKDAGLAEVRSDGNYRIYSLNSAALETLRVLRREDLAALAAPDDDAGRVLQNYLDADERLTVFPSSRKKLLVILRWLAGKFEPGRRYSEREVNEVILRHHDDYATLRRELIGARLMERAQGIYWRTEDA